MCPAPFLKTLNSFPWKTLPQWIHRIQESNLKPTSLNAERNTFVLIFSSVTNSIEILLYKVNKQVNFLKYLIHGSQSFFCKRHWLVFSNHLLCIKIFFCHWATPTLFLPFYEQQRQVICCYLCFFHIFMKKHFFVATI